jgi:hypothetical protein
LERIGKSNASCKQNTAASLDFKQRHSTGWLDRSVGRRSAWEIKSIELGFRNNPSRLRLIDFPDVSCRGSRKLTTIQRNRYRNN